jgi:hypothetical protein
MRLSQPMFPNGMTVTQLRDITTDYVEGTRGDHDVLIRIGRRTRRVSSAYLDGRFILIAGEDIPMPD